MGALFLLLLLSPLSIFELKGKQKRIKGYVQKTPFDESRILVCELRVYYVNKCRFLLTNSTRYAEKTEKTDEKQMKNRPKTDQK